MYCASADNVIKEHEQMYNYVEKKMKTLRLGLKSYRYFDQAKALADKVGVVLNETMMNESSSLGTYQFIVQKIWLVFWKIKRS